MASVLEQVAVGFDQAKQTIYNIMKKYYPKVNTSRSTLVNAFVSGIAYIYSMYQVFAKMLQDELYVSTAKDMDSLYKLIPFVGIELGQPQPMQVLTRCQPQIDAITNYNTDPLYIFSEGPITDTSGNAFHHRYGDYTKKTVALIKEIFLFKNGLGLEGNSLLVSLGKYSPDLFPMSIYGTDEILVEFVYKCVTDHTVRKAKILFSRTGISNATVPFALYGRDGGCDVPSDFNFTAVVMSNTTPVMLLPETGLLIVVLHSTNTSFSTTYYAENSVIDTPISMTFKVRSVYARPNPAPLTIYNDQAFPFVYSAYNAQHVKLATPNPDPPTSLFFAQAGNFVFGFFVFAPANAEGKYVGYSLDPYSVKLKNAGTTIYDFSVSEKLTHALWGDIYKAVYTAPSGTRYYAYVLDEWAGYIVYENPGVADRFDALAGNNGFEGSTKPNNNLFLEQYDTKISNINPSKDFNFANTTYTLEAADILLFNELEMHITDPGYENTVFEQVQSVVAVQSTVAKIYFEIRLLGSKKVEIRFQDSVDFASINNVQITYKTVKDLSSYKSGTKLSGSVVLKKADGTVWNVGGATSFNFLATNIYGSDGASGIPTLEGLRDLLMKAAYTYDKNVTKINYEAAISNYYLGAGYDARIKVFGYEDFGDAYLDSFNGNIVFFLGIVNRVPNLTSIVLTVTSDDTAGAQYTREQLTLQLPGLAITDTGLKIINFIGFDGTEIDAIQASIRASSTLTNIILSRGSGTDSFGRMYAVYFKLKLRAKNGYTFDQARAEVKAYIASLFSWQAMQFIRDINVSDTYRACDSLPSVDKLTFLNFSHYHNNSADIKVHDITYIGIPTAASFGGTPWPSQSLAVINSGSLSIIGVAIPVSKAYYLKPDVLSGSSVSNFSAVASGNKITLTGTTWEALGFYAGMRVNINGFTTVGNSGDGVRVVSITGDSGKELELNTLDIILVNESSVASVRIVDSTDFRTILQVGRIINIDGFTNAVNNLEKVTVSKVRQTYFEVTTAATLIPEGGGLPVIIDSTSERDENPAWDYSEVAASRQIYVDILGLGGIEVEEY